MPTWIIQKINIMNLWKLEDIKLDTEIKHISNSKQTEHEVKIAWHLHNEKTL